MEKNKDLLNIDTSKNDTSKNDTSKKWRKGNCEYENISPRFWIRNSPGSHFYICIIFCT